MTRSALRLALGMTLLGAIGAGCRPDPGMPVYLEDAMPQPARLTVGAFFSGAASDSIPIDDSARRLDVFSGTIASIVIDNRDRVDGQPSSKLGHAGMPWWGLGIDWDIPTDLSRWKTMHVSFKSSDPAFAAIQIGMDSGKLRSVDAGKYDYKNDGSWHTLAIPLADFIQQGFDPTVTRSPFVLGGGGGKAGEVLRVAGLYFDEN